MFCKAHSRNQLAELIKQIKVGTLHDEPVCSRDCVVLEVREKELAVAV